MLIVKKKLTFFHLLILFKTDQGKSVWSSSGKKALLD